MTPHDLRSPDFVARRLGSSIRTLKRKRVRMGDLVRPGQPKLGNETAITAGQGPGSGRMTSKSGSQMQYGAPEGKPRPQGRDILMTTARIRRMPRSGCKK